MALSLLLIGACSDDDPTGVNGDTDGDATVRAMVTDQPGGSAALLPSARASLAAARTFSGTMTANANVEIHSETRGWVSLGSPSSMNLTLQSTGEATVHGSARVPADSYNRVRLVFSDADATISAGSVIGSINLDGNVQITVGGSDGQVTIEKSSTFTLSAESSTELVFDLNSETWVNESSAESRVVSDAEISSATTVIVR